MAKRKSAKRGQKKSKKVIKKRKVKKAKRRITASRLLTAEEVEQKFGPVKKKRRKKRRKAKKGIEIPFNPPAPLPVPEVKADETLRARLLADASELTLGDRNRSYGDPLANFTIIANIKKAFWDGINSHGPALAHVEQNSPYGHAIDMVINNLGRIASAPSREAMVAEDRYKDGVNYLAIAYEIALKLGLDL